MCLEQLKVNLDMVFSLKKLVEILKQPGQSYVYGRSIFPVPGPYETPHNIFSGLVVKVKSLQASQNYLQYLGSAQK